MIWFLDDLEQGPFKGGLITFFLQSLEDLLKVLGLGLLLVVMPSGR